MFLEILNSCITTRLKENPNLVYALLHEKEVIGHLQTHHKFQDIMFNINVVCFQFLLFMACISCEACFTIAF